MSEALKIAIIGDFNFTYNAHHATNLAIEHSAKLLDLDVNYYWIRIHEATGFKESKLKSFDGIWLAPGPFENGFFLNGVIKMVLDAQTPVLITGEGFKTFLEVIIKMYNLNPNQEKVVSDNLSSDNQFEKVEVRPLSKSLINLYKEMSRIELTNSRYSIYPHILDVLKQDIIDVEALNQFDEPEVISLKSRQFCVATMSLPQICSTREMPHPLISAFLNYIYNTSQNDRIGK
jgi:CTP synthase (UTP-ammonia lyase)